MQPYIHVIQVVSHVLPTKTRNIIKSLNVFWTTQITIFVICLKSNLIFEGLFAYVLAYYNRSKKGEGTRHPDLEESHLSLQKEN